MNAWRVAGISLLIVAALAAIGAVAYFLPVYAPPEKSLPPSVLMEYHVSGGIAGLNDFLTVYSDGTAAFSSPYPSRNFTAALAPEQLSDLKSFISSKEYSLRTESLYDKTPKCCDLMFTSVLIYRDGKTISIESDELVRDIFWDVQKKVYESDKWKQQN